MSKMVSTRVLTRALEKIGFAEVRSGKGSHRIFKHTETGLLVTIPGGHDSIRPVHLSAIRRQISNFDIASDIEFDKYLSPQGKRS
jgi:predicted RNA binding protein YcfA (HicA-like mRNA interferase family)